MSARSLANSLVDSMGRPLSGGGVVSSQKDPEGLIAYYSLEDTFGAGNNVVDATGLAYTLVSDARTSSTTGVVGNAGTFAADGSNPANAQLVSTLDSVFKQRIGYQSLTISLWARINISPAGGRFFAPFNSTASSPLNQHQLILFCAASAASLAGGIDIRRDGATIVNVQPTLITSPVIGTWYHIVAIYNALSSSSNYNIYVNNSVVHTSTQTTSFGYRLPAAQNTTYLIGTNTTTSADASISIDEVGVWNKALSASEVSFLYNSGAGRSYAEINF